MNRYKEAILKDEISDFLLGKNRYFVLNKDYGDHDITSTYYDILNFGIEENEKKLFTQIDQDITSTLKNKNLTINDYTNLFGFIWFYFKYRFDYNKFKENWDISNCLIENFKFNYDILKKNNDMSNVLRINDLVKNKYGYNILGL